MIRKLTDMAKPTEIQANAIARINSKIADIDVALETISLSGSYTASDGQQTTQADVEKLQERRSDLCNQLWSITKRIRSNG